MAAKKKRPLAKKPAKAAGKVNGRSSGKAVKTKPRAGKSANVDADMLWQMYRKMVEIRLFEEHVWDVYTRGLMPGLAHLYIGEESVAVGVCSALRNDDYITSTPPRTWPLSRQGSPAGPHDGRDHGQRGGLLPR